MALAPPPEPPTPEAPRKPSPKASLLLGGATGLLLPFAAARPTRVRLVPHPVWNSRAPLSLSAKLVPPTAVAKGELAGKETVLAPNAPIPSPASPDEKLIETPSAAPSASK